MDDGRGGLPRQGRCYRMFAWGGRMWGGLFRSAIREVDMSELSKDFIKRSLEELRRQFENGDGRAMFRGIGNAVGQDVVENVGGQLDGVAQNLVGNVGGQLDGLAQGIVQNVGKELDGVAQDLVRNVGKEFDGVAQGVVRNVGKEFNVHMQQAAEVVTGSYKKGVFYTVGGAISVICAWYGVKLSLSYINGMLQKPKVIIRSSQVSLLQKLEWFMVGKPKKPSTKMIFPPKLDDRLNRLIEATKHINKHIKDGKKEVKYRNVLLYGKPGTGKTLFARKLSHESGLEFVELTGSSFFQEGAGIGAMDELFGWAKKSKNGLCIFIDEADSLLPNREMLNPASQSYRIVNHFLNYLGERSSNFMVVMATNHHTGFDGAMHRRIDDAIEMPLPAKSERYKVLQHYRQTILHGKENGQAFGESVKQHLPDKKLQEIAQETKNFSYGDMHGIVNKLRTDAFTTKDGLLNPTLVNEVIKEYKEKYEALKQKPPKKTSNNGPADLLKDLNRKRYGAGGRES